MKSRRRGFAKRERGLSVNTDVLFFYRMSGAIWSKTKIRKVEKNRRVTTFVIEGWYDVGKLRCFIILILISIGGVGNDILHCTA